MAILKNYQKNFLLKGSEQINFKVYDSDGNYKVNEDKNILASTPRQLHPLYNSLVKSYEKPIKRVELPIKLNKINVKNANANFTAVKDSTTDFGWKEFSNGGLIISDLDQDVKAISGNKYMRSLNVASVSNTTFTEIVADSCLIKSKSPFSISYNSHIKTSGTEAEYVWTVIVQAYTSGGTLYSYKADENVWVQGVSFFAFNKKTKSINKWDKNKFEVAPLVIDGDDDDIDVRVKILLPSQTSDNGTFNSAYIDNAFVGETNETDSSEYIIERKISDGKKTITGEIVLDDQILSNDLKDADYFNGKIEGSFRRPRDTADKKLEQIITQEIINDFREYLPRYEGTFFNYGFEHLSMHNKIYLDFGSDTFQETVSSYIDSMTHRLKSNEYDLKLHTPNQNNDLESIYQSKYK